MKRDNLYLIYYSILGVLGLILLGVVTIGYTIYYPIWAVKDFLKG